MMRTSHIRDPPSFANHNLKYGTQSLKRGARRTVKPSRTHQEAKTLGRSRALRLGPRCGYEVC